MICEVSHFAGEILSPHAAVLAFVLASHCDFTLEPLPQIKSPLLHTEFMLSTYCNTVLNAQCLHRAFSLLTCCIYCIVVNTED